MKASACVWHDKAMDTPLDERSRALRRAIVRVLDSARRGHVGASFSLVEIMRALYDHVLRYDAANPRWPGRDRCILSKGHGCLAQYVMLAEKGFFPSEELGRFCAKDALLGGHPDGNKIPGVEACTGSLGHGLPVAVGLALAARYDGNGGRVFVIMGDGECNEGSVWEAALAASKHGLDNLVALVDYNKYQSYGRTCDILELEPFADKWRSFGFVVAEANGHDTGDLRRVLDGLPLEQGRPSVVICHTVKGKGAPFAENDMAWHHKSSLKDNDIAALFAALEG
mgnify:CR=1 FL=1